MYNIIIICMHNLGPETNDIKGNEAFKGQGAKVPEKGVWFKCIHSSILSYLALNLRSGRQPVHK